MPLHMTVAVCKCYTVCVMLRGGVCERNVLTQNTQRIRATSRQDRQRKGWSSQYRENICVWVCTCGEGGEGEDSHLEMNMKCIAYPSSPTTVCEYSFAIAKNIIILHWLVFRILGFFNSNLKIGITKSHTELSHI